MKRTAPRNILRLGLAVGLALMGAIVLAAEEAPIVYSSYLGGSDWEEGKAIAVDTFGRIYIVGGSLSSDFPLIPGPASMDQYRDYDNFQLDPFLAILSPQDELEISSYLGLPFNAGILANDRAEDVDVNARGDVCAAGWSSGYDTWANVWKYGGYSRALYGEDGEQAYGTAVDHLGNCYVTGVTWSFWFPVERPNLRLEKGRDTFIVKLDPSGSVQYATLLGTDGSDTEPTAIAVDSLGQVTLTGRVGPGKFPAVGAAQADFGGGESDAFVAKLDAAGALVFSTYLGGSGTDKGRSIVLGSDGGSYVAGITSSPDFPVTPGALEPGPQGGQDIFLARLSPEGTLVDSTFLGGPGTDEPRGIDLDGSGDVYLASATSGGGSPLVDPGKAGCFEALVARLDLQSSRIVRTACVPGADARDIAVDPEGSIYVTGAVQSPDFPLVNAFQPTPGGSVDAFVAKLRFNRPPDCSAALASPGRIWPPDGRLVPVSVLGVIDPDDDPVTLKITGIRQDEPLSSRTGLDATGLGTPAAMVRADRIGGGDGRVYHLNFEARDDKGSACNETVKVCVPHDRRPGATCGDGGALFDSTTN